MRFNNSTSTGWLAESKAVMAFYGSRTKVWLFLLITQIALISCATSQRAFFHSFSFNTVSDAKVYGHRDIEVLNYAYGSSGFLETRPDKADREIVAQQHVDYFRMANVGGAMPRGEYLYVKWRVKATGEVHEDKVDLTQRLPADMTNYGLHFAIFGSQLYVYLFPPFATRDELGRTVVHVGRQPSRNAGMTLQDIPYARQHQIYPDPTR